MRAVQIKIWQDLQTRLIPCAISGTVDRVGPLTARNSGKNYFTKRMGDST